MSTPGAYAAFREKLERYCQRETPSGYLLDGPLTEAYWSATPRIVAVNLEAYGYERSRCTHLEKEIRNGWLQRNTPFFTIKLVAALKDRLRSETPVTSSYLRANHRCRDVLPASVEDTAYVNVRKSSNKARVNAETGKVHAVPEDTSAILKWTEGEALELAQEQFRLLAPDIVVVGGRTGAIAASRIFGVAVSYLADATTSEGTRICSVRHPSRVRYADMADAIERIVQHWNLRQAGTEPASRRPVAGQ